jgi:hypothetical protein
MTDDDHHRLWKLIEFVKHHDGQMLEAGNPSAVRFVVPGTAVDDLSEVLEASEYTVIGTFEPNIFSEAILSRRSNARMRRSSPPKVQNNKVTRK